jgi:hypothetical protein
VSRERWLDEALEASDRALFVRRARALPSPSVPELGAILAAADARPRRKPGTSARAGALVALSLAAAAVVLGIVTASALTTHERGPRAILADEGDASVPLLAGWTSYEPPVCEPGAEEPGADEACVAVPASLVVASSDGIPRACVEPLEPVGHADDFALTCKREPEMSSP